MSLKKTDMVKNLARKLDGRRKAAGVPARFAQGAADVAAARAKAQAEAAQAIPKVKLVPLACRLPADLVNQLRERALTQEGGMNAVVAQALTHWLAQGRPR